MPVPPYPLLLSSLARPSRIQRLMKRLPLADELDLPFGEHPAQDIRSGAGVDGLGEVVRERRPASVARAVAAEGLRQVGTLDGQLQQAGYPVAAGGGSFAGSTGPARGAAAAAWRDRPPRWLPRGRPPGSPAPWPARPRGAPAAPDGGPPAARGEPPARGERRRAAPDWTTPLPPTASSSSSSLPISVQVAVNRVQRIVARGMRWSPDVAVEIATLRWIASVWWRSILAVDKPELR